MRSVVLRCSRVTVRRDGRAILDGIDWQVSDGERWIVMGPNGAGKTTLARIAAARAFPTSGTVEVLGGELGGCDLAELRTAVGWASGELAGDIPAQETVADAVMTAAHAVTGRWREAYGPGDAGRAEALIAAWGLGHLRGHRFGTLSEGERKRVLIARALMADPELLVLDEPGAGLDLGGREDLALRLGALARDPAGPCSVVVTHHVEEIPVGATHALLLRGGTAVASGPVGEVIASGPLSEAFGLRIEVTADDGRFAARAR